MVINVLYVDVRKLNDSYRVVQYADLIPQDELESRFVIYRDSLNSMIDDMENCDDIYISRGDFEFLRDLLSEYLHVDENGEHVYPDWYIFE